MDFSRFAGWLADEASHQRFSGAVLVEGADGPLFGAAHGMACRPFGVPNTLDTRFATASVTKAFTSVAVLRLAEEGLLSLDRTAAGVLGISDPALPDDVTIRHLLTHTSGIGDYLDEDDTATDDLGGVWEAIPNHSMRGLDDFLPLVLSKPVKRRAGKAWNYCNSGYILLGLIVERVSSMTYFRFVTENILHSAGMADSGFHPLDSVVPGLAEGYMSGTGEGGAMRRNSYAVTAPASDGGLVSTVRDLIAFLKAIREERLLGEAMTRLLLTPVVPMNGDPSSHYWYGHGMGFLVDPADGNRVVRYGHRGDDPGVSAAMAHYPGSGIGFAVCGNITECASEPYGKLNETIIGKAWNR